MKQETKDQLREILCEVPEVEKDVKIKKLGCLIRVINGWDSEYLTKVKKGEIYKIGTDSFVCGGFARNYINREVIGNPLQERHLFMYCESKGIRLLRASNGLLFTMSAKESEIKTQKISVYRECEMKVICMLENQDLEDQSEETGQKLIKFLLDNK